MTKEHGTGVVRTIPKQLNVYRRQLMGTPEAMELETALHDLMPDWMAAKIAHVIVALVEKSTEQISP